VTNALLEHYKLAREGVDGARTRKKKGRTREKRGQTTDCTDYTDSFGVGIRFLADQMVGRMHPLGARRVTARAIRYNRASCKREYNFIEKIYKSALDKHLAAQNCRARFYESIETTAFALRNSLIL
jgi:hypothetical protein